MEEGAAPPRQGTVVDEAANDDHLALTPPLPLPPGRGPHDTYIVQFPKDQVYRVPPRENAIIMERYRNPPKANENRRRRRCPRVAFTAALIVVAIVAIVGITLATLYLIFNPKGPTFSVTNFVVKNPGNKNSRPRYEISLRAKNPNKRLGIEYQKDYQVFMLFEETKVASGKFPTLKQGPDSLTKVQVELTGSNGPLPKQMEKSLNDGKSNMPIVLDLNMKLGVRVTATSGIKTWVMKSNVACDFKVSTLKNDTKILSQACDANFKQH